MFTHLQALIALKLTNSLLGKDMPTWHEVDRLDTGAQRLRGDGANPALAAFMAMRIGAVGGVLGALSINFELKFNHIPERLHAAAKDFLAVGLGADALDIIARKQELEHGIFVVEIAHAVRHNWPCQYFV